MTATAEPISDALLAWYDRHARELPWRIGPSARKAGERPDPYRVWLSEIMLQQTTVAAVKPFFERFVNRWPGVEALAGADESEIMAQWAGLGYYSRARNLHACARAVTGDHGGRFPGTSAELKTLPGIGDYTSAAIAAIAFDEAAPVVDGNIERVVTRLFRIATPLPKAKSEIRTRVAELTPAGRPGDFAQAMMDLGATVCTPRSPSCLLCPLTNACEAASAGDQTRYPVKAAKKPVPTRRGAAYVARRSRDGAIWLRRRPASGMLGGMSEAPSTDWSARSDGGTGADCAPFPAAWRPVGEIEHGFTHFRLILDVFLAEIEGTPATEGWWALPDAMDEQGLSTLMRKVVALAEASVGGGGTRHAKRPGREARAVSATTEDGTSDEPVFEDARRSGTTRPARLERRTRRTSARWSGR